jgi:acyl-CoA synthetase (NDP forming)
LADVVRGQNIRDVCERVLTSGRTTLLEPEGYAIAALLGITTPSHVFVSRVEDAETADLSTINTASVVLKVVSREVLHKTDVGGVRTVANDRVAIVDAMRQMERCLLGHEVSGYLIAEFVPHSEALGGQLLIGMRWTTDFGPVVTVSNGGVHAEWLADNLKDGRGTAVLTPSLPKGEQVENALKYRAFADLAAGKVRGSAEHFEPRVLAELLGQFLAFADSPDGTYFAELEINPLVPSASGPMALDVLARLRSDISEPPPARPLHKLQALLQPSTIALMGVSEDINPGRIILRNTLREGFPRGNIYVVKPNTDEIDGVRCCPDLASLPDAVDLLVLSVAAGQVPDIVDEVVASRCAKSIIVIPGGLGERNGTADLADRVATTLRGSRATDWQGPIVNGGNCLGVLSRPGRYDTTFIPDHKLPEPGPRTTPLALISQSGAFAVSRLSKLLGLNPRYSISIGNQVDLTVGDYLAHLKDDREVEVFACYVEGFRPLDGQRWLAAAREIVASGRQVILYRAGRTPAGARATASHTAAIAGDYTVARELARAAGVVVADSLADFDDLIRLFCYLQAKTVGGWRLGAVSNAGFECVAIADNLGRFELASLAEATVSRIDSVLRRCRLDGVVEARNPVDLTPIMSDSAFGEVAREVLHDDMVDVGFVGCVPLTGALNTLEAASHHDEDIDNEGSIVRRLVDLRIETSKPWIAVVDAGPLYDAMARKLQEHGVPTFRTADRALRLFEVYCRRKTEVW